MSPHTKIAQRVETHVRKGRFPEAAAEIRKVLRTTPGDWLAITTLSEVFAAQGQAQKAMVYARRALSLAPAAYPPRKALAAAQELAGDLAAADATWDALAAEFPDSWETQTDAGLYHLRRQRFERAVQNLAHATRLNPDAPLLRVDLAMARRTMLDWTDHAADDDAIREAVRQGCAVNPLLLMATDASLEEQMQAAVLWSRRFARPALPRRRRRASDGRLRIGYLSGDFYDHPTSYLVRDLIARHDRRGFEIIGFDYGPEDDSTIRRRLLDAFDAVVDLRGLDDRAAAGEIAKAGIDVLVDLKGFTENARAGIVGFRPAPVQVNYLGFPGTMGADFIDYVVADARITPSEFQAFCVERIVHLPGCFQPNDAERLVDAARPTRREVGLPQEAFVFGAFNAFYKFGPRMLDTWVEILKGAPGSVLWMLEPPEAGRRMLRAEAAARGVDPERLVFAPRLSNARHLARLPLADLGLDTLPVGAFTTASDALWMGLPMLTQVGETAAGRGAMSLLHAMGLPELIADTREAYVARAIQLAREPERLAALRERIHAGRDRSPLFDAAGRARALEAAYRRMVERHAQGLPPEAFAVDP